ncbi:Flp family type IVb pilin [Bacillus sp. SCS-153A]|uniref:Flp family type IVb pilin n=1 Tax=Rossellomorea sedimentorum TaxID=3115294 RepID=UPI003905B26B
MMDKLKGLVTEEQGQGMTEYGLVLGIIAIAVVASLGLLRTQIVDMFDKVVTTVTGASTGDGSTTNP